MNIKVKVTFLQLVGIALMLLVAVMSGLIANHFQHWFLEAMLVSFTYMVVGAVIHREISDVVLTLVRRETTQERNRHDDDAA
jgi:uncharacterized membrane protein SirB2